MTSIFYKIWLPISLAFHVLLICLFGIIEIPVPAPGPIEPVVIVGFISPAYAAEAEAPMPITTPEPVIQPPLPVPLEEDHPPVVTPPPPMPAMHSPRIGSSLVKDDNPHGKGFAVAKSTEPGREKFGPSKAAALMTSPNGTDVVPKNGDPDGIGRYNIGYTGVESGPSLAAAAKGGPLPNYPKLAEESKQDGTVKVAVDVSETGTIDNVRVSQSSGYPELDRAAMRAARAWSFEPALIKGVPASDTVYLEFLFSNGKVMSR